MGERQGLGAGWETTTSSATSTSSAQSCAEGAVEAKEGKVHDLGLTYERRSYKFPGTTRVDHLLPHPAGMLNQEIRTP